MGDKASLERIFGREETVYLPIIGSRIEASLHCVIEETNIHWMLALMYVFLGDIDFTREKKQCVVVLRLGKVIAFKKNIIVFMLLNTLFFVGVLSAYYVLSWINSPYYLLKMAQEQYGVLKLLQLIVDFAVSTFSLLLWKTEHKHGLTFFSPRVYFLYKGRDDKVLNLETEGIVINLRGVGVLEYRLKPNAELTDFVLSVEAVTRF